MESCKQIIGEWWVSVGEGLTEKMKSEGHKVTNKMLRDVFIRTIPTVYSSDTVLNNITKYRSGEYCYNDTDKNDIINSMAENAQTARDVFMPKAASVLDLDPLGITTPDIDIKKAMFDVPDSYATYKAPLKLDGYGRKLGIVSDLHLPIHDRAAVLAAHSFLKKEGIDCLLLMGDIMDTGNLTRHAIRKRLRYTWREELEVGRAYISSLRVLFPDIPIVYSEGNHEQWFTRFIANQATQLDGDYVFTERMQLEQYRIEWVEEERLMTYGDLYLHHGHRLGVGGGVNPAQKLLDRHCVNLMVGHYHKEGQASKRF